MEAAPVGAADRRPTLVNTFDQGETERLVHPEPWWAEDPDMLGLLTWQVVSASKSVLIFTNSKKARVVYGVDDAVTEQ